MALTTYHHGVTATETSNITPIIKSVSTSTIALISTSADADDEAYPLDTPVLLTGITTTDLANAGSTDTLMHQCLRTIKAIQNTNVVVLRLSDTTDFSKLDLLLTCQTRLNVTPKILVAPEIDTPDITRKLVEIAKKRRAFVYASPRRDDGMLITDKTDIAAYRATFSAKEVMIVEGGFGAPRKLKSASNTVNFLKLQNDERIDSSDGDIAGLVYSIDGGEITSITESIGIEQAFAMYSFLPTLGAGDAYLAYGRDGGFGWSDADMPDALDIDNLYWFGLNALALTAFFAIKGVPAPDGAVTKEVVLTVYPASSLPAANIDYDIFDLIIDPANYTAADLQYFASKGITPATKNPDGSYTIKSQLTLPRPSIPV